MVVLLEQSNTKPERKYGWVSKWVKMTGDRARIDAKANNTYIIYEKEGKLVKEFPNGQIYPFNKNGEL